MTRIPRISCLFSSVKNIAQHNVRMCKTNFSINCRRNRPPPLLPIIPMLGSDREFVTSITFSVRWLSSVSGFQETVQTTPKVITEHEKNQTTPTDRKQTQRFSYLSATDEDTEHILSENMTVLPDFLSEAEEQSLLNEIEPYMQRLHYEYDHWDDVCEDLA